MSKSSGINFFFPALVNPPAPVSSVLNNNPLSILRSESLSADTPPPDAERENDPRDPSAGDDASLTFAFAFAFASPPIPPSTPSGGVNPLSAHAFARAASSLVPSRASLTPASLARGDGDAGISNPRRRDVSRDIVDDRARALSGGASRSGRGRGGKERGGGDKRRVMTRHAHPHVPGARRRRRTSQRRANDARTSPRARTRRANGLPSTSRERPRESDARDVAATTRASSGRVDGERSST